MCIIYENPDSLNEQNPPDDEGLLIIEENLTEVNNNGNKSR